MTRRIGILACPLRITIVHYGQTCGEAGTPLLVFSNNHRQRQKSNSHDSNPWPLRHYHPSLLNCRTFERIVLDERRSIQIGIIDQW